MQKDEIKAFKNSKVCDDIKYHAKYDFNLDFSRLKKTELGLIEEFFYRIYTKLILVFPAYGERLYFKPKSTILGEMEAIIEAFKKDLKAKPELFEKCIRVLQHYINSRNFDRESYQSVRKWFPGVSKVEETPELKKINELLRKFTPRSTASLSFPWQVLGSTKDLPKIILFSLFNTAAAFISRSSSESEDLVINKEIPFDSSESSYGFFSSGVMPDLMPKPDSVAYHVLQDRQGLQVAGFSSSWPQFGAGAGYSAVRELTAALTEWSEVSGLDWQWLATEELQQLVYFVQKKAGKIIQAFPGETDPFVRAVQDVPRIDVSAKFILANAVYGPTVWVSPGMVTAYAPMLCNSVVCKDVYENQKFAGLRPLLISEPDLLPNQSEILEQQLSDYSSRQLTPENQQDYVDLINRYLHFFYDRYTKLAPIMILGEYGVDKFLGMHFSEILQQSLEDCFNGDPNRTKLETTISDKLTRLRKAKILPPGDLEKSMHAWVQKFIKKEICRVVGVDPSLIKIEQLDKRGITAEVARHSLPYKKNHNIKALAKKLQAEYASARKSHQKEMDDLRQHADKIRDKVNSVRLGKEVLQLFTVASQGKIIFVDNNHDLPELPPYAFEGWLRGVFYPEEELIYVAKDPEFISARLRNLPLAILTVGVFPPFAHQLLFGNLLQAFCHLVRQHQGPSPDFPKAFFTAPYWSKEEKAEFAAARKSDRRHIEYLATIGRKVLTHGPLTATEQTRWNQFIADVRARLPNFKQEKFKHFIIKEFQQKPDLSRVSDLRGRTVLNEVVMVDKQHWISFGTGHLAPGLCNNSFLYWSEEVRDRTLNKDELDILAVNFLEIAYFNQVTVLKGHLNDSDFSAEVEDSKLIAHYGYIVMAFESEELTELVVPHIKKYVDAVFTKYGLPLMKSKYFANLHAAVDSMVATVDPETSHSTVMRMPEGSPPRYI